MPPKAKYTREQLESMLAELDSGDDVDEVIVEQGGRRYHLRGKRATTLLDSLFADQASDDDDDGDDGDEDDEGDDVNPDPDKQPSTSIWGRRK